jgi:ribonucleotide reductase beta subunit family protein with ferritin-like domain
MHTEFACLLYSYIQNRLPEDKVCEMIKSAVEIEMSFITESIPCSMIGMNSDLMKEYIMYIADRLLVMLGYPKIYKKENPFHFIELSTMEGKTNFFEKRVSEYSKAGVSFTPGQSSVPEKVAIDLDDDF